MTAIYEALGSTYTKCCATCKHWEKVSSPNDAHGDCEVNTYPEAEEDRLWKPMLTLDLSLCSKWEVKEDDE